MSSLQTVPNVFVVTAHGRQKLISSPDERLLDVLLRNGVPWSAISAYSVPADGGEPILCPALDRPLSAFGDSREILLYFNRNVNPFLFSVDRLSIADAADPDRQGTEYIYQRLDNDRGRAQSILKKLSPDECRAVIAERVAEIVEAAMPDGGTLVVGVSGGGDSNALLHGLSRLRERGLVVRPVIIKGIPDWDLGVPRAQGLCNDYGLDLRIIEEPEVRELLGMPSGSDSLIDRFEREFKGDDFEFVGTLLIRLALSRYARDLGTSFIATGLNLEDVLCEAMFRVSSGMKPAAFPVRKIGDTSLIMPLWQCPKRIIDGCFPKLSLQNYDARYPCFSLGRNLYYSVVYAMQSQYPAFVEQMVRGLSKLSMEDPVTYSYDEQLGFHVERFVPFPLRQKFQRMIGATLVS